MHLKDVSGLSVDVIQKNVLEFGPYTEVKGYEKELFEMIRD